jgi:hypothetical protein
MLIGSIRMPKLADSSFPIKPLEKGIQLSSQGIMAVAEEAASLRKYSLAAPRAMINDVTTTPMEMRCAVFVRWAGTKSAIMAKPINGRTGIRIDKEENIFPVL